MAENVDRESKTEEATPRRIDDALSKGNTPFSREASGAALLIAVGLFLPIAVYARGTEFISGLTLFLDKPGDVKLAKGRDVVELFGMIGGISGVVLGPIIVAIAMASVLASGLQNFPRVVWSRIKPDVARISPGQGLKRIFGVASLVEFLKSLAKILVIAFSLYVVLKAATHRLVSPTTIGSHDVLPILIDESKRLFLTIGLLMAALAAADVVWSRLKWRIDLRMSRHELKDEAKDAEGNPMVRARRQSIARNRARHRAISAIPRATLVVANPTHYAVAMRYVQGETAAPLVVAKGIDHLAVKIREVAERNGIPIVEDKALARSLYAAVQADRPIPPEFYRSVASIILHLMTKKNSRTFAAT